MCTVSMVVDHYRQEWKWRWTKELPPGRFPTRNGLRRPLTQDDVDELRRLLERARAYDLLNNERDCPTEEKINDLKELGKSLGVDVAWIDAVVAAEPAV